MATNNESLKDMKEDNISSYSYNMPPFKLDGRTIYPRTAVEVENRKTGKTERFLTLHYIPKEMMFYMNRIELEDSIGLFYHLVDLKSMEQTKWSVAWIRKDHEDFPALNNLLTRLGL